MLTRISQLLAFSSFIVLLHSSNAVLIDAWVIAVDEFDVQEDDQNVLYQVGRVKCLDSDTTLGLTKGQIGRVITRSAGPTQDGGLQAGTTVALEIASAVEDGGTVASGPSSSPVQMLLKATAGAKQAGHATAEGPPRELGPLPASSFAFHATVAAPHVQEERARARKQYEGDAPSGDSSPSDPGPARDARPGRSEEL